MASDADDRGSDRTWLLWAIALTAAATAVRVAVLGVTPLELYPDEAQYWLWSTEPGWGYASKPPMIAWLIAATTGLFGHSEAAVRLAAPLLHSLTSLVLFEIARRLYDARAGLIACALWLLMPAVALSSLVIATDAPLLLFWSLALLAYAQLWRRPHWIWAVALGAALGLAFLSKQAALYFPLGLALHAALDPRARAAWSGWRWLGAVLAFLLVISPNLAWQAANGFATLMHTAEVNAGAGAGLALRPLGPPEFLLTQIGVFGPFPFFVLLTGATLLWRSGRMGQEGRLLLSLAAPPLLFITAFSLFREVEANWASAAFPSAIVAVAAWLSPDKATRWRYGAFAMQGLACALFVAAACVPQIADRAGAGNALKRLRGWQDSAAAVVSVARAQAPLTAVAVEDRSVFNELAFYGRDYFSAPGAPPLRIKGAEAHALNQAQLTSPLTGKDAGRVLLVNADPKALPAAPPFMSLRPLSEARVALDGKRERRLAFSLGEGWISSRSP